MSYEKFKPNVMAASVLKERERVAVFIKDCTREYEGTVKNVGDSVTIKGAGKVTMRTTADGQPIQLSDPEVIEGTNAILTVRQQTAFNFMVPDIDAAQGVKGAVDMYSKQAGVNIANIQDQYVASFAADPEAKLSSSTATQVTANNVLTLLDEALQWLYEQDVPSTEKIVATVSPRFWMILRQKYVSLDTDNSEMLKRGALAMYSGMDIKMSNNVATASSGANDLIMIRTQKAIAFVDALTKIEPKRANNYIADEVRGVSLYDAKLIRPKEMYVLNVKYTS